MYINRIWYNNFQVVVNSLSESSVYDRILFFSSVFILPQNQIVVGMDCLVLPVSIWKRRSMSRRCGYQELSLSSSEAETEAERAVRVVVGKEEKEFFVEPFVLEESPFRALLEMVMIRKEENEKETLSASLIRRRKASRSLGNKKKKKKKIRSSVIYVDVDSILFEHMLWLMYNDCSSLFQLNLTEIIDFYAQDY